MNNVVQMNIFQSQYNTTYNKFYMIKMVTCLLFIEILVKTHVIAKITST